MIPNRHLRKSASSVSCNMKSFEITERLSQTGCPVYKVISRATNESYALKIFYFQKNQPCPYYQNELRFSVLNHPNIIRFFDGEFCEFAGLSSMKKKFGSILMELAPYGDFADLAGKFDLCGDEKLVRSYFHQLVEGVQFLHKKNMFHLDLKLENLLLGANFALKIADFDGSYRLGDSILLGNGTKNYRAPEIKAKHLIDPCAGDLYSLGIILFILVVGHHPYSESDIGNEVDDLWEHLLKGNTEKFWTLHSQFVRHPKNLSEGFKKLFMSLTRLNPRDRATIKDIKRSSWYLGPVYTDYELRELMKRALGIDQEKKVRVKLPQVVQKSMVI